MAIDELITDPDLTPLLATSQTTLEQTLSVLDWLAENYTTSGQPSLEAQLDLSQQQKRLYAHVAKLRGQNRRAAFGARATKQETAEARQEVDRLLLQLQNLYYEQRHLLGEIGACENYDHAYAHLPLLPLDQYVATFPEQSTLPEQEMMPLRIEHEKQEREKLEQQRLELVKVKEGLTKENTKRKEELRKMDEKMEETIEQIHAVEQGLTATL